MNTIKQINSKLILICIILCSIVGCDYFYPPVIINDTNETLLLEMKYKNSQKLSDLKLNTKGVFYQRAEGLILEKIIIKNLDNRIIAEYNNDYLKKMRKSKNIDFEVWVIHKNRLELHSEEKIKQIQQSQPNSATKDSSGLSEGGSGKKKLAKSE